MIAIAATHREIGIRGSMSGRLPNIVAEFFAGDAQPLFPLDGRLGIKLAYPALKVSDE